MSNYKRLISYIYAYEGGIKGKNIGFAKIEIRGEQCRILVNVKKVYVGSNDIGVYLLSPKVELLLGRIFIRNGSGEFRIHVNGNDIEGSGLNMDECYGLTVHDVESAWQCYTTIWDDAVTQAAETTLEDVTSSNVTRAMPKKQDDEEYIQEELPIAKEIERELMEEEMRLQMVAEPGPATEPLSESEQVPELRSEPEQMPVPELQPEPEQMSVPELQPEPEQEPVSELHPEPETSPFPSFSGPEDLEKLKELDRLEREQKSRNRLWDQLQSRYAKVLAFDYDKGCEILSIKPQDIGLLPREIWVYGNNSFLLHGFYNYRHLILAKLNDPEGTPRYLLGVPGHYFSNEKYMASMFGFPHFVLARKQPEEDGRFGYWYTDIRL